MTHQAVLLSTFTLSKTVYIHQFQEPTSSLTLDIQCLTIKFATKFATANTSKLHVNIQI